MLERWNSPSRSRRLSRQAERNGRGRSRRVGANGGEAQRIHNEIVVKRRAWENSPEGIAAILATHEKAKQRDLERREQKLDWINAHIAETAVKIAAIYGREEPTEEDHAAASAAIGATFMAMEKPEYNDLQNFGWRSA